MDNGASFYSASGDYISLAASGVETATTAWAFHTTSTNAARTIAGYFPGAGVEGGVKMGLGTMGGNDSRLFVASSSPVNALRISGAGANLTAGSIYVFAR